MAPDSPSGFFPGLIHYFAGTGAPDSPYSDGSLPTQVGLTPYLTVSDSKGNIYISSNSTEAIYMVWAGGTVPAVLANVTTSANPAVTPVAGRIYQIGGFSSTASCGACDGMPLNQVPTIAITGLAVDAADNLYYSDSSNSQLGLIADVVRRVDAASSNVSTVAGQWGVQTAGGDGDGSLGTQATLNVPEDIKLDQWGNLYINDNFDDLVRVVYLGTQPPPILTAENSVGSPQKGFIYSVAGQLLNFCVTLGGCGDGGPALSAGLGYESTVAVDPAGNVYIADTEVDSSGSYYPYIRIVYAGGEVPPLLNLYLNPTGGDTVTPTPGVVYPVTGYGVSSQFAACASPGCGDGGTAAVAQFGSPDGVLGMVIDASNNVYVADPDDHAIRKLDASGYISTIAGIDDPTQTPPGTIPVPDGGLAVGTYLNHPYSLSEDPQGNLYVADTNLVWQANPLLGQTVTLPDFADVTYGALPVALTATDTSGLPVQYSMSTTPAGIAHINGTEIVITGVGSISVTASQPGNDQYAAAQPVTKSFNVGQASLTVTANPASEVSGGPVPTFSATITGFVNGDNWQTPGVYSGSAAFSVVGTNIVPSIGTLTSTNYSFAKFISGTLTITGSKQQSITFSPISPGAVTYGQAPITMHATASSGNAVTFLCLGGPCQLSGTNNSVLTITGGGKISIEAYQAGDSSYQGAQIIQNLVVNPAVLNVTGPTVTVAYGTTLDPTKFPAPIVAGFVNPDTAATTLTGSPAYSVPSGQLDAGTYAIVTTLGSLLLDPGAAANYVFAAPVNGSLVIEQAVQTINFNPISAAQSYGQQITLTAVATSGLPVTYTVSGPLSLQFGNIVVPTGTGTGTVTAIQAGNVDYAAAAPVSQIFTVGPALLNVQALNLTREQGAPNPALTYQIGCTNPVPGCWVGTDSDVPGVITGIPDLSTTATDTSVPGTYPIAISQGTLAAPNYSFVFIAGTLTVTPAGSFAITASPPSLTIARGLSGQATITLTPANAYQGTVTLNCGQVPANVSCVVSPSTYTFPGSQNPDGSENAAQGTVTINTLSGTVVGAVSRKGQSTLASLALPGFFGGLLVLAMRRSSGRWLWLMRGIALLLAGGAAVAITSCGGKAGTATAAPGTITISINGSGTTPSGNATVTTSMPLTVIIQ